MLRDPLIHFLAIGVVLFSVNGFLDHGGRSDDTVITVDAELREALRAQWSRQRGRAPTQKELDGLIESRIREEVLYREALALGLDRDDTIVRRRLAQKLEFLVTDAALPAAPDEAELRAFFEANRERYAEPARLSFRHVYFSPDRGPTFEDDARAALVELEEANTPFDASKRGDRFMLDHEYVQVSEDQVARDFGREFARRLFATAAGSWRGPIPSGYGLHLVRVHERIEARPSDFEAVRASVERDYLSERTREINAEAYERLRARYQVVVEAPDGLLAAEAAP